MRHDETDPNDMVTMSFGDHLEELRLRLLLGLAAPVPVFVVVFLFSNDLIALLLRPVYDVLRAHDLPAELQVLSPPEYLMAQLKLSIIAALVITGPWLLYQLWKFVAPGLYRHERRFVYFLIPGSAFLTVAGLLLLYYVMLPLMLEVLVMVAASARFDLGAAAVDPAVTSVLADRPAVAVVTAPPEDPKPGEVWLLVPGTQLYAAVPDGEGGVRVARVPRGATGEVQQAFRVSSVIDFTLVLMLGTAVAFQMPLVIMLLGWLGLVTVEWLRRQRKYAILVCGAVSAIVTPPDAASMIIMMAPLYGLYELGILLIRFVPPSRVAEGRIGRFGSRRSGGSSRSGRGADKHGGSAAQPVEPAQPDDTVPRTPGPGEPGRDRTDGDDDE